MRQQINLFQSVLIDKQEPLQSRQVGLLLLGFSGLLVLLSLFHYWQLQTSNQQLLVLQQQKSVIEKQVLALEQQYPERQKNVQLEDEIDRAKEALAGQKQLLGYFADREEQGNVAVLDILDGLARHRSPGVWLRRIQLGATGKNVALSGSALRPEQVPLYLQSLGKKKVLGGQVFSRLTLARIQERAGQVDFSLESLAGEHR